MNKSKNGISVLICCHNSAKLIPMTLIHLLNQKVEANICWEVILVDNASKDDTVKIAKEVWGRNEYIPLRIIHESRLGLSNARKTGIKNAKYNFISFVDDDNRVSFSWLQTIYKVMLKDPHIGICGGETKAAFEIDPPDWFDVYKNDYAVGKQALTRGVLSIDSTLWGAGMTLRRAAWNDLMQNGFNFLLSGRKGNSLTSGEDSELCLALQLAGWKIWYEPDLVLTHYIPAARLKWNYLRNLYKAFGHSQVFRECYQTFLKEKNQKEYRDWRKEGVKLLKLFLIYRKNCFKYLFYKKEGDANVLFFDKRIARLKTLLILRKSYNENYLKIEKFWNKIKNTPDCNNNK